MPLPMRFSSRLPFLALMIALVCSSSAMAEEPEYAVGADVSFLPQAEAQGIEFKDNGEVKPGLQLFRDHGYNWVRLRLFHTPTRLPNDLEYTIAAAKAAKALGFKVLLNFHYSDTWADPGKQFLPQAWEGKSDEELVDAMFEYTRNVIIAMREAGAMPDMVQPGNEVIAGMMWPSGRLPQNWEQFAALTKAGIRGVEAGVGDATPPQIMIHIDRGGDLERTRDFFDHCREHEIEFDVIGQSYYPWWHGSLDDLRENMAFMAEEYEKPIMLVEVAYNWRRAEYRDEAGPFPETPEGQREFLRQVDAVVRSTPHGRGAGVFWWEPAVPPQPISSRGMFDDEFNSLPVIKVFDSPAEEPADEPAAETAAAKPTAAGE